MSGSYEFGGVLSHVQHLTKILVVHRDDTLESSNNNNFFFFLILINEVRTKEKTYICVSV